MNDIAFPEKPLQADTQCSKLEKKFPELPILRQEKFFDWYLQKRSHKAQKQIGNEIAFPEKPLQADIPAVKRKKKFSKSQIRRQEKFFDLYVQKRPPMAQKKIINEIAFPEKHLQADISCSEVEKKFPEWPILRQEKFFDWYLQKRSTKI